MGVRMCVRACVRLLIVLLLLHLVAGDWRLRLLSVWWFAVAKSNDTVVRARFFCVCSLFVCKNVAVAFIMTWRYVGLIPSPFVGGVLVQTVSFQTVRWLAAAGGGGAAGGLAWCFS